MPELQLQLPKYATKDRERLNQNRDYQRADHFGIKWNKWVFVDAKKSEKDQKAELLIRNDQRQIEFRVGFNFEKANGQIIRAIQAEQQDMMVAMQASGWSFQVVDDLQALWRTVIGLGNNSVYEVSMTLHHTYGIPYVPATTLKGIVRSWIIRECFKRKENRALENGLFVHLFGETDQKGAVVFFDAFPQTPPVLRPDVMNVLYPDYYMKGKAPGDWQAGRPVYFLTLDAKDYHKKPLKFQYLFGLMPGDENTTLQSFGEAAEPFVKLKDLSSNSSLLETVGQWTKRALYLHGLGSKTSRGYGRQRQKKLKTT